MNPTQTPRAAAAIALAAVLLTAAACRRTPVETPDPELPEHSVSRWTAATELFMEHPSLVAGQTVRLAVHLTTLDDFKALTEGRPSIEFRAAAGGNTTTWHGGDALRPGAFRIEGVVPPAGTYTWVLRVSGRRVTDAHELGPITVYPTADAARSAPAPPEGTPAISYLKEQQWVSPFSTTVVQMVPVRRSVRAPALVVPSAGGEAVVSAPASGRLVAERVPRIGDRVAAGMLLARLEPRLASVEDRALLVQQAAEARAALSAADAEWQRAQRLVAERAVPARRVEDATRAVTVAKAQLEAAESRLAQRDQTLKSGGGAAGDNSFDIRTPIAGTVVSVGATPGAAYEVGAELFRIVRTDPVTVELHLPPTAADLRGQVADIALEMPGSTGIISGRIVRQSATGVLDQRLRAFVYRFDVSNADGRLLVGQAGTVVAYLRGDGVPMPVVPATAVLTEAGRPFVFVQVGGESFERRAVELGTRDGDRVSVKAGVKAGDRVVVRGTYDVLLASAARGLPAEGHVH